MLAVAGNMHATVPPLDVYLKKEGPGTMLSQERQSSLQGQTLQQVVVGEEVEIGGEWWRPQAMQLQQALVQRKVQLEQEKKFC